jgi:predicted nucleic acid-binding Zn ribbon protein
MTEPPSKFYQIHSNASQRADKSNAASTLNEIREREREREREFLWLSLISLSNALMILIWIVL